MIKTYLKNYLEVLKASLEEIDHEKYEEIIKTIMLCRERNKRIFICGNGGSSSTASHFACDLTKGTVNYNQGDFVRIKAISLNDNIAIISAIGNDISFENIFEEQLKAYMQSGDVVIAISASGNSPNILKCLKYAKENGATTIGFYGFMGGQAKHLTDIPLFIESQNVGIAEDFHIIMVHTITQTIRRLLSEKKQKYLFLDRDGVINEKANDNEYIMSTNEFIYRKGIFGVLQEASKKGYKFVIITNQQCIGKGVMNQDTLKIIHEKMKKDLEENGILIDKIYYCPHLKEKNCFCRKPKPGLFYKAMTEIHENIDLSRSFYIGDSRSDAIAGKSFGVKTILLKSENNMDGYDGADYVLEHIEDINKII